MEDGNWDIYILIAEIHKRHISFSYNGSNYIQAEFLKTTQAIRTHNTTTPNHIPQSPT
jgi:hypothetical protein